MVVGSGFSGRKTVLVDEDLEFDAAPSRVDEPILAESRANVAPKVAHVEHHVGHGG
jgi:hypothetical protein